MIFNFPKRLYQSFIEDTVRLYKVMPRSFKWRFWYIQIIQLFLAIIESCSVLVLAFFGTSMANPDFTKNSFIVKSIFKYFPSLAILCEDNRFYIACICFVVMLFIIFKNLLTYFSLLRSTNFSESFSAYISEATLECYLNKNYFWHISPESSSVIQKLNLRSSLSALLISLIQFYSLILCSFMLFFSLFMASPQLTILVVIIFSSVGGFTYLIIRKRVDKAGKDITSISIEENTAMMAAVRGIREVLIYRQQKKFLKKITSAINLGIIPKSFLGMAVVLPSWYLEVAGFFTIFFVLSYMVYQNIPMPEIIAAISMLMLTAWRILPTVSRATNLAVAIRGQRPMALTCLDLLETFIAQDSETSVEPDLNFHFEKTLTLENVFFRYPTSNSDVLKDISLNITKGQVIGLIGPSGSGKSTLAMILSGLMPLEKGKILIDGKVLTPSEQAAYCQQVGFVSQTPFIIGGTLADNIAFSQWGEKYDRDKVEHICRNAAMDFVFAHPKGIDLAITADGNGLSGGQAQRVSIARSLFNNPEVIIFDEATSALDQANENIIMATIENLAKNVTAIIIAHRLSTVEKCDRIIWVDNGQIVADGEPKLILSKYKESQNSYYTDKNITTGNKY